MNCQAVLRCSRPISCKNLYNNSVRNLKKQLYDIYVDVEWSIQRWWVYKLGRQGRLYLCSLTAGGPAREPAV